MKRLITLIGCIFFSINVYAQLVQIKTLDHWHNGVWEGKIDYIYTYDDDGLIEHQLSKRKQTGSWKSMDQTAYTKDSDGLVTEKIAKDWDDAINDWENARRFEYTYTTANKLKTETLQIWDGEAWINSTKETLSYDQNNFLIQTLSENWNGTSWIPSYQINYTNNSNGSVTNFVKQYPNSTQKIEETTYTYTRSGKVKTITYKYFYSGAANKKEVYTYDNKDYLIQMASFYLNSTSAYFQAFYTNNTDGSIQQYVSQTYENGAWKNERRIKYTKSGVGISETETSEITAFPNPTSGKLYLTLKENAKTKVTVIDLQGHALLTTTFTGDKTTLDIENLPSNVYLVVCEQNENLFATKIVKN